MAAALGLLAPLIVVGIRDGILAMDTDGHEIRLMPRAGKITIVS